MNISGFHEQAIAKTVYDAHLGGNDAILILDNHIHRALKVSETYRRKGHAVQFTHDTNGTHLWISKDVRALDYAIRETDDAARIIGSLQRRQLAHIHLTAAITDQFNVEKVWQIARWACDNGYTLEHFSDSSFHVLLRKPHECFPTLENDVDMDTTL